MASAARDRYLRVFRAPHARGLLLAEIPARLPMGINGLAIVLFLREHAGSYAAAGATAAAFGAAVGATAPLIGRLIDQRGLRSVVLPFSILHAVCMAGLLACGLADAPLGVLLVLAVGAGAFFPPIGSVSRSLWPRILGDDRDELLPTALAVEGVLVEMVFSFGPLLVALIAAVGDPAVALGLSPVLLLVGMALFVVQPPARTWIVSAQAGGHGLLGALRSPGIRTLMLITLPMGFCFGTMEVTLPAFGEDHGHRELGGVLLAVWSLGSAAGGVWYGARVWRDAPGVRLAKLAALLPLGYLPLALAPSILAMAPLALLAGLCIAPTLTAANQIAGAVAPEGAETEAYTWPITALVAGLALGNLVAGAIVDGAGWKTAFLVSAGGAAAAAVTAVLRRGTLGVGEAPPAYAAL